MAGQLGDPGAFFQEGLAGAVGNKGQWQGRSADGVAKRRGTVDLSAMAAAFDRFDPAVAYPVAGSFVANLIRAHGIGQVTAYFRACGPGADRAGEFERRFGQPLAAAAAEWRKAL